MYSITYKYFNTTLQLYQIFSNDRCLQTISVTVGPKLLKMIEY